MRPRFARKHYAIDSELIDRRLSASHSQNRSTISVRTTMRNACAPIRICGRLAAAAANGCHYVIMSHAYVGASVREGIRPVNATQMLALCARYVLGGVRVHIVPRCASA